MANLDKTVLFDFNDKNALSTHETLTSVYDSLKEKGYNPINQIVGYLLSGDPAYIPRHNDARNMIRHHERDELLEELIKSYIRSTGRDID